MRTGGKYLHQPRKGNGKDLAVGALDNFTFYEEKYMINLHLFDQIQKTKFFSVEFLLLFKCIQVETCHSQYSLPSKDTTMNLDFCSLGSLKLMLALIL